MGQGDAAIAVAAMLERSDDIHSRPDRQSAGRAVLSRPAGHGPDETRRPAPPAP